MKRPKACNHGRMRPEKAVLDAYALYFAKFVRAYAAHGMRIDQVHVQNEPDSDQKVPSSLMKHCFMNGAPGARASRASGPQTRSPSRTWRSFAKSASSRTGSTSDERRAPPVPYRYGLGGRGCSSLTHTLRKRTGWLWSCRLIGSFSGWAE
jgi:hypothetical protein